MSPRWHLPFAVPAWISGAGDCVPMPVAHRGRLVWAIKWARLLKNSYRHRPPGLLLQGVGLAILRLPSVSFGEPSPAWVSICSEDPA